MKRCSLLLSLVILFVAACDAGMDEGGFVGEPSPAANLDPNVAPVTQGTWYRPAIGVTWQWQLQGTINMNYQATLYDIDLFEAPADVIEALHTQGRKVICYFSAGSGENYRPDYEAFLPSDLGRKLDGYDNERWLDIRSASVVRVMEARLDLAVTRGCDGVEPDNVTAFNNDTGFAISATDQLAFNRHLANEAHRRGLSIALKNDGDQVAALVAYFDFELNEECHQYEECEQLDVFIQRGKPVLNAEYTRDAASAQQVATTVCPAANQRQFSTLILSDELDDAFRVSCQ
jgi:hypothetical protein